MKFEEKIAKEYFEFKGYDKVKFEPIGNTPPDFLINDSIAVEVRRLNKFHSGKPLEKIEYNVIPKIEKFIKLFELNENFENTTIVSIYYSRPIKFNEYLKREIAKVLESYSKNKRLKKEYEISDNLNLGFFEHNEKWESQFEVGGIVDLNRGGFVVKDICDSLKIIIHEKERKVEKFKNLYENWWLVLIDFIGYGIHSTEIEKIKNEINENNSFKKIILISPTDSKNGKEINYS
ncbi:hypothetical protein [Polaribacter sp. OB-PA-B3]